MCVRFIGFVFFVSFGGFFVAVVLQEIRPMQPGLPVELSGDGFVLPYGRVDFGISICAVPENNPQQNKPVSPDIASRFYNPFQRSVHCKYSAEGTQTAELNI